MAPTTTEERIIDVCRYASGFLYYVSLKGVTGSASIDVESVQQKLAQIRKHTELPICVGFGVKNAAIAKQIATVSDGVVVGSAFVDMVAKNPPDQAITDVGALASEMRSAIDSE